jgi:hypothetical protein
MTAAVANQLIDQLVNPSAKPPKFSFTFDDFLKREFRFGISADRPGERPPNHHETYHSD